MDALFVVVAVAFAVAAMISSAGAAINHDSTITATASTYNNIDSNQPG